MLVSHFMYNIISGKKEGGGGFIRVEASITL